jgi:hypothetical protein
MIVYCDTSFLSEPVNRLSCPVGLPTANLSTKCRPWRLRVLARVLVAEAGSPSGGCAEVVQLGGDLGADGTYGVADGQAKQATAIAFDWFHVG